MDLSENAAEYLVVAGESETPLGLGEVRRRAGFSMRESSKALAELRTRNLIDVKFSSRLHQLQVTPNSKGHRLLGE